MIFNDISKSAPPSSPGVTARMSKQGRADTGPELALRRLLHSRGKRYRVGWPVPGMPRRKLDIAFTKAHVAVNVHGCFWHRCPEHFHAPKANADWWRAKFDSVVARDEDNQRRLVAAGWLPVIVWQHEDMTAAALSIARLHTARGGRWSTSQRLR